MSNSTFPGFPKELPEFFAALSLNNNKAWFEDHKAEYQDHVVDPAMAFIKAMEPFVAELNPPLKAEAKLNKSLRRIHRDVRFSKDKTPYNPRLHIIFWAGNHPNKSPACHVVLASDHLGIGAGQWGFDKNHLQNYRDALENENNQNKLIAAINQAAADNQNLQEPALKKLPRGYEAEGMHADLLRQKSIVVRNENEPYTPETFNECCIEYFINRLAKSNGVNQWLMTHIWPN